MVYTVTLNPALDYVMTVENLRLDDINRSANEGVYYGGKGINVSVVLTRLGVENKALGFVGGFTGDKLVSLLTDEGVACDFNMLENGDTRINVKIKADTEFDINAAGPEIGEADISALMQRLGEARLGDYVILAGSAPSSLGDDVYERILAGLQGKGVNAVVDATGELLRNVLKYKPFLVKPNHHELGDLFGVKLENAQQVEEYARRLQKMGARNVLVSCGKDGAMLLDENGEVDFSANIDGKIVSSVGCGDSMVAGFVAGYIKKSSYDYALKLGSACGNASAFVQTLATKQGIMDAYEILNGEQDL